mgnify:CR=1 FL=1
MRPNSQPLRASRRFPNQGVQHQHYKHRGGKTWNESDVRREEEKKMVDMNAMDLKGNGSVGKEYVLVQRKHKLGLFRGALPPCAGIDPWLAIAEGRQGYCPILASSPSPSPSHTSSSSSPSPWPYRETYKPKETEHMKKQGIFFSLFQHTYIYVYICTYICIIYICIYIYVHMYLYKLQYIIPIHNVHHLYMRCESINQVDS